MSEFLKYVWSKLLIIAESTYKSTLDMSSIHGQFTLSYSVFNFFFFLSFALLFYVDYYAQSGILFNALSNFYVSIGYVPIEWIDKTLNAYCIDFASGVHGPLETCVFGGVESTLFAHSLQVGIIISVIQALYYFIRYGAVHDYVGQVSFYYHGFLIPIIVNFLCGWPFIFLMLAGGYMFDVFFPAKFGLLHIPFAFIFLSILHAGIFQIIISAITSQWMLILPYKFHPMKK